MPSHGDTFTCDQGHRWQQAGDGAKTDQPRCPICAAATELADDATAIQDAKTEMSPPGELVAPLFHGPVVPHYEILETLGRGGMGVVYKARQLSLNRMVALKMLPGAGADSSSLQRFRAEAEAVAQLQHPNIVQIYEIGDHEGRPYFAMELVEGIGLAQALSRTLFPFRETAQLVATLAQAVQYAHEHGIIHRDLKPGNILLQITGSRSQNAKQEARTILSLQAALPKITDFGVAKRLYAPGVTAAGAVLGTPSYMPPEQATGDVSAIGPAADIYALGAVLYEMLTGQPPFCGQSATAVLWSVVHEDPPAPSQIRPHLPVELEAICLTCLHKDPRRRYASAQKLADDLHAFLAGLPTQARPAGIGRRLLGWLRAYPAAALFGGVGGIATAGMLLGAWFSSPLAVAALAVASLCLGAWWYSARLERALADARQQNVLSQRGAQRMHLLLDTVQRLLAGPNIDARLRILSEAAARLVDAERATIFLIDEARGELWSKVALGEEEREIRVPIGAGIAGSVAQTGKAITLNDPYADPRFNQEIDRRTGFTTRNLLTVPMTNADGRRLGVFQVLNKRGGPFGVHDVETLGELAKAVAMVVV